MSFALAIVGLAILILVHEAGHMFVARAFGMRVDKFSIFFGPTLLRWRGKHTTYQIAAVPLGGFVQIAGMNPNEQLPEDDPGSYQNKSRFAQFSCVFAGPLINYLFAMVLIVFVMLLWGTPSQSDTLMVYEVTKGLPAQQAGLQRGDELLSLDGKKPSGVEEVNGTILTSAGKPIRFLVKRGGEQVALNIKPVAKKASPTGGCGQGSDPAPVGRDAFQVGMRFGRPIKFVRVPASSAFQAGLIYPVAKSAEILGGLKRIITGKISTKQMGGPVEMVRQLKMSFETNLGTALLFLAMLNVYLGLFNLLPLPALDGGRLVFILLGAVSRRSLNQRVENMIHTVGFVVLLALLALLTYRDVGRIFD